MVNGIVRHGQGTMPALVAYFESKVDDVFLTHLQVIRYLLLALFAPAAFVQGVLRFNQIAMSLQQPLNSVVGTATLLIRRKRNNDVAIRLKPFLLILNEIGDPNGGLGFIVCGAATVIKGVFFDKLKRIHAPIFALGFYYVGMRKEKNRFSGTCAVIADDQVGFRRDRTSNENVGIGKFASFQPRGGGFSNRRSRTRRIAGMNFNKLLVDIVGKLLFCVWPHGLAARRKAKQDCKEYSQFEHAGDSFMRNRKHATDKSSCVNRFQKLLDDEQTASQAHPTIARLFHRPNEPLAKLAGATGLEPAASCVTGRRSNQLNYAPALKTDSL